METTIHPGHEVLRKQIPDTKLRREVVAVLCVALERGRSHLGNVIRDRVGLLSLREHRDVEAFIESI